MVLNNTVETVQAVVASGTISEWPTITQSPLPNYWTWRDIF